MVDSKKSAKFAAKKDIQHKIMRHTLLLFIAAVWLIWSCGDAKRPQNSEDVMIDTLMTSANDSMIHGLVCDGCNDTIIIFLQQPYQGSDPDTLNILEASKQRKVFGHPDVGDKLALLRSKEDSTIGSFIIVLNDLEGAWCYKVKPSLRLRADVEGHTENQQLSHLPDSVRELLNIEYEYGINIKSDHVASPIGWQDFSKSASEDSPVEYPTPPHYNEWRLSAGRFILLATSIDSLQKVQIRKADTTHLVELKDSTLVLHFADGNHTFYRKP